VCYGLCAALVVLGIYPGAVFGWANAAAEALLR